MTLYRQLLLFTMILGFLLFIGVWILKLQSTQQFLEHQLEAHAQDTATSLALSMSPLVAAEDFAGVETMMNAIYDRGYYKEITFSDIQGEVVSNRLASLEIDGVPNWFIQLLPLNAPGGTSLVMAGWKQAGNLYVESHPGYAYQSLWSTFAHITGYFLLTGFIVFITGSIALKYLLRPLRRVEEQAEAICRREYTIQEPLPRTRELKRVVTSMNKMTGRVQEMFEEQSLVAEKLRESAYRDPLTGLGNRRFLEAQIDGTMAGGDNVAKGVFLFAQIQELQILNEEKGYNAGDELLVRSAEIIYEILGSDIPHSIARLTGGDFGIFLPDADKADGEKVASELALRLTGLSSEVLSFSDNVCSVGGIYYNNPCSFKELLAKADTALAVSRHEGPNGWYLESADCDEDQPLQGKLWWRENLEQSLAERSINLYGQHVVKPGAPNVPLHMELYSRITIDREREVPAGIFIPLAERAEVITQLDRKVVELMLDTYHNWQDRKLAINLSGTSIIDPDLVDWLYDRLQNISGSDLDIYFELSELSVVRNLEAVTTFSRRVKELGHHIGVDHFGRSFSNFGYLKSLQPTYVKIDRAFTRELELGSKDAYFFVGSLRSVAHSLDIKVIGEGVEKQEQLSLFEELRVDGIQGYLIEQPKLMTSKF
ncbi:MAG: EAL domain-containing protein [Desulfofustis sp.]|nr:EAL domain-containing protein [Desulfofustis sp.]